jgi:hypothetical protein
LKGLEVEVEGWKPGGQGWSVVPELEEEQAKGGRKGGE